MFEREPHQRIAALLKCMDEQLLLKHHCLLGGGTAIALARGEYREARHIELNCGSAEAYRAIRQNVDDHDPSWLFRAPVQLLREPNFVRHGIRVAAALDDTPIPIEIILESRIPMKHPAPEDRVAGVWSMAEEDLVATRLMANADRYADDACFSRDIIDLAMLATDGILSPVGVAKARTVYGKNIDIAWVRAREMLLESDGRLIQCMGELKMKMHPHDLRTRIERLDFVDPVRWWE